MASKIRAWGSGTRLSGFTSRAPTVTLGDSVTFQCFSVFVLKVEIKLELSPRAAVSMEWNNIHIWGRILPDVRFAIHERKLSLWSSNLHLDRVILIFLYCDGCFWTVEDISVPWSLAQSCRHLQLCKTNETFICFSEFCVRPTLLSWEGICVLFLYCCKMY